MTTEYQDYNIPAKLININRNGWKGNLHQTLQKLFVDIQKLTTSSDDDIP